MDDVGERIGDLAVGQRPRRPVREAHRFVEPRLGDLVGQRFVAHLVAIAEHHRRHLGVEKRRRHPAGEVVEDLEVLARGMEDLEDARIDHQLVERPQIETGGQRIDRRGLLRTGDLHQAETRPEGAVAQELGIDGDVVGPVQCGAEAVEAGLVDDERHVCLAF